MYRVKVICPRRNETGYALAGVETSGYPTLAEGEKLISSALEEPDLGVLLIDEAALSSLDQRLTKRLEDSEMPLVLSLPMEIAAEAGKEYLERVIRRVIGYQVRLR